LLLPHSPNILLIPGTSSVEYLREDVKAASLQFPPETVAKLDAIGTDKRQIDGIYRIQTDFNSVGGW